MGGPLLIGNEGCSTRMASGALAGSSDIEIDVLNSQKLNAQIVAIT
jgi:hypothetical protein